MLNPMPTRSANATGHSKENGRKPMADEADEVEVSKDRAKEAGVEAWRGRRERRGECQRAAACREDQERAARSATARPSVVFGFTDKEIKALEGGCVLSKLTLGRVGGRTVFSDDLFGRRPLLGT